MKKASPTAVAGRRLRRYLGALLAIGFGASWWSFIPPARADAAAPRMTTCMPKPVSLAPVVRQVVGPLADAVGKTFAPHGAKLNPDRVKHHPTRPKRRPFARLPPPRIAPTPTPTPTPTDVAPTPAPDVTSILTDEPIRIGTRSS